MPTCDQLSRWAEATPREFVFSVKLTGAVVARPSTADRFCATVRTLGQRLDVFGYFKHEDEPTGPRYAQELLSLLRRPDAIPHTPHPAVDNL